ncbi:3-methyl-2-oxobutanoate hydroxymethyltransferase [Virgibacillus siamensis]|uniref:3-methyl-2-oxobutanoate hydroxymethyltransferase n=1 Tax=Virgibacillus siamensis TaxID=480071 RepID=UPI0009858AE6|nr:3-methyl-2-oxobutanoate hydroxymethyltransferase [Virgibacillus siamensis]
MLSRIDLQKMKTENRKIAMVTAYDYPSSKTAEAAGVDMILVGDSLGMVVLGYDSTVKVTMDDMVHHGKAVQRGAPDTFVVIDMPFMSYHISLEQTLQNAQLLIQETDGQAVKLEGASEEILQATRRLTEAGIPVVAHLGLTPQSVHVLGGYKVQGKDKEAGGKLLQDAKNLADSGAIALVLECVPEELAAIITAEISIPTIGIGAGVDCDGQVLVYHDILQYGVDRLPKFVKAYADFNSEGKRGLESYIADVREMRFPSADYTFKIKDRKFLPETNKEE